MHIETNTKLLVLVTLGVSSLQGIAAASTHQRYRRQVPQEWAHAKEVNIVDKMLKLENPLNIKHPIFSLLGKKAGSEGMGKIDPNDFDCFQKMVADQAFTNAKKASNKEGQEAAIIFASVEKNTPTVGVASAPCKSKKMENPEIERLIQHQDAASKGATENNKKSALLAALSLKEIGSDPHIALRTGTFKAGDPKNTNNGRGLSCDDDKDAEGCIYTKNALVEDVTKAEIDDFVKKHAGGGGGGGETDKEGTRTKVLKDGAAGELLTENLATSTSSSTAVTELKLVDLGGSEDADNTTTTTTTTTNTTNTTDTTTTPDVKDKGESEKEKEELAKKEKEELEKKEKEELAKKEKEEAEKKLKEEPPKKETEETTKNNDNEKNKNKNKTKTKQKGEKKKDN